MSWYTRQELRQFRNPWTENTHKYILNLFEANWGGVAYTVLGISALLVVGIFLDMLLKRVMLFVATRFVAITKLTWAKHILQSRVFNSFVHLTTLLLMRALTPFVMYPYPKVLDYLGKGFELLFILIMAQFIFRLIDAILYISDYENSYKTVALRTFGQLMKVVGVFFVVLIIISVIFNVKPLNIFTTLGAVTAILLLIFRDAILGFVTGLQIASSRTVKVGDWISVPKHNIEGLVKEINLISAKVQNFDKTVSSIPTFELINTEVKNFEPMRNTNTRRIKRAIMFNVSSFRFLGAEDLEQYKEVRLLSGYINEKQEQYDQYNAMWDAKPNANLNSKKLTNIGLFRKYTELYLHEHEKISKNDVIMVRQMEVTPQGMPLEIWCFTTTTMMLEYEAIKADIFDHLLTASKEFGLEVSTVINLKNEQ
ncbi:MAG: mechanosensitive ion channel family protein [Weeksellaceae bacterium]|nr:mechanosensitive ion channel family protein [Weeksellaceae bacterium]